MLKKLHSSSSARARRYLSVCTAIALFASLALACSSEAASNDSSCEYTAFGETGQERTRPTAESLGMFDAFILFRVTGHEETGSTKEVVSLGEVTEAVHGGVADGEEIEVRNDFGVCLEAGEEYYLLLDRSKDGDFYEIRDPWSHFPVINNRVTLHSDMRKDELIGEMHGLDPVLFKRRLIDLTGRTDIQVD